MHTKILELFNRWFASAAGVWQTFGVVLAIVVFEQANHAADPNGFWLLYWLTVYSAVTQPVLAYVARRQGDKTDVILGDEFVMDIETQRLVKLIAAKLGIT